MAPFFIFIDLNVRLNFVKIKKYANGEFNKEELESISNKRSDNSLIVNNSG